MADRFDRLGVLSRVASFCLTAVLIVSTLCTIEAAGRTRVAAAGARTAHALDDDFEAAHYAVGAEESLNRKYRLEPSARISRLHRESAAALDAAMEAILINGDARDRSIARYVLQANRSYLVATKAMYAAVDRGDGPLVLSLDRSVVDPVFGHIERAVEEASRRHRSSARHSLEQLDATQGQLLTTTVAFSMLGLVSLGVFLVVLVAYQRRLKESHELELDRLEEAAHVDSLTGIGNHRAYQEDFKREVSRAQRYGETLSLVLIDIDDFKVINDRSGHMHGDEVLKALAALLGTMRTEDRPYRVGGDEFAALLPHTATNEAMESMQRLSSMVRTDALGVTVSIGIATASGSECDLETLQAQADAAMYAGKRAGRSEVTAFDESIGGGMWALSPKKIHSLRELITGGRMEIAFQPIWDVDRGRALAYEALARPDPAYGFDGPQEAFDLAERIGRAHELDAICRHAALVAAGGLPAGALLFLNVSPQSLDHGRLDAHELTGAVRAAGLAPERVVIEITERSITRVDAVIEAARALQKHGFRLALDDTGAGNSGLEIMSRLTFEFVKIDREVIVKALHDRNARGVLAGIVAIAEATDAYVIAEGIETREMLEFVCRVGETLDARRHIRGVQGYLLRRPSESFPDPDETGEIELLLKESAAGAKRVQPA